MTGLQFGLGPSSGGVWHSRYVRSAVTIGVFDGVHLGHRALIRHVLEVADAANLTPVVLTFDPNPLEVLQPTSAPVRLCSVSRRVELIEMQGVAQVEVLPFTFELSQRSPMAFIDENLRGRLGVDAVVVGKGFRFGRKAAGTVQTLRDAGLKVVEYALVGDGSPVSSTRIREAVAAGDVSAAARMLGRPHEVEGIVVAGHKRGRELGYPTANISHHHLAAVPADGVYAGSALVDGVEYVAAISVGTNPTFDEQARTVEAFLLDFEREVYGEHVRVSFVQRLRGMVSFDRVSQLVKQMADDVARTRHVMG